VASLRLWAIGLAAGGRPRLGARLRDLGRRQGHDDGLASFPDTRQFTAAFPNRGHRLERRHGIAVAGTGHLALGDLGHFRFSVLLFFGLLNLAVVGRVIFPGDKAA